MGNGQPFPAKLVGDAHGSAELPSQSLKVGGGQVLDGCAVGDHLMGGLLKQDKVSLSKNGGIQVVELRQQEALPRSFVSLLRNQRVRQNSFAKHRGGFRERQGGVEREHGVVGGHHTVERRPQFVC